MVINMNEQVRKKITIPFPRNVDGEMCFGASHNWPSGDVKIAEGSGRIAYAETGVLANLLGSVEKKKEMKKWDLIKQRVWVPAAQAIH